MKIDCNVARDLMPLVIDHAASGESEALVNGHCEECPPCKEYMAAMQRELTDTRENTDAERADFDRAAQRLRKQRRGRILRNVLLGMVAGVLLVWCGMWGWQRLTVDNTVYEPLENYDVSLAELPDGRIILTTLYHGTTQWQQTQLEQREVDGKQTLCVSSMHPRIPTDRGTSGRVSYQVLYLRDMASLAQIVKGTAADYEVVWRWEDEIPMASGEMADYLALADEYLARMNRQSEIGFTMDEMSEVEAMQEKRDALRETVPEWKLK